MQQVVNAVSDSRSAMCLQISDRGCGHSLLFTWSKESSLFDLPLCFQRWLFTPSCLGEFFAVNLQDMCLSLFPMYSPVGFDFGLLRTIDREGDCRLQNGPCVFHSGREIQMLATAPVKWYPIYPIQVYNTTSILQKIRMSRMRMRRELGFLLWENNYTCHS